MARSEDVMQHNSDRKIGGRSARKPWRLGRGGTASRIVQWKTGARARGYVEAIEVVVKIADVP
jgi:hypothetical protein